MGKEIKREGKNCVTFLKISMDWISCFYFCNILFFITGNAPLILKILIIKLMQFCFLHANSFFSLMCFYLQFCYWFFWTAFVISIFFHWCISFIIMWIMNSNYNFISNNVKGIKASEKRLKLFEYLRNNNNNGSVFLQETHSSLKYEQIWKDDLKGPLFLIWKK